MKKKSLKKQISLQENQENVRKLVNFLLEYRTLKRLPRGCLPYLKGSVKENIAEHSFYTTIIGWILAKLEKGDEDKIIKMCLIHDLCEVRGGEKNLINKFYTIPNDELKITTEISRDYNLKIFFLPNLFKEFKEKKTKEAKIARDADILAQMLLEKESFELGNKLASKWLVQSFARLKTKMAKKIGKRLIEVESDEWWLEIDKKYLLKTGFL